jgi:hypothetical protein
MGNWSDGEPVKRMQWNPRVRDNDGTCYRLEDACDMVNDILDSRKRLELERHRDTGRL